MIYPRWCIIASPTIARLTASSIWTPDQVDILHAISWTVYPGQRWTILGPNGAGKTTLLSLLAAERHPSAGTVDILGQRLGQTDLRLLRHRIGKVDPALRLLDWMTAREAVITGLRNTLRPTWRELTPEDHAAAAAALDRVGASSLADRALVTMSHGEKQRVRIARALIRKPALLLLDEPTSGLDFPAREGLLAAIDALAEADPSLPVITISHHLEEIPLCNTHVLLLSGGRIVQAGPTDEVLTDALLTETFGFPITVRSFDGRWYARAVPGWHASRQANPHKTHEDE